MHNAADRDGAVLLEEAKAEIVALRNGVNECYRMLLAEPNTKLALDRAETLLRELMQPSVAGKVQLNVGDLAQLVARLARALRQAAPDHDLPAKALDYLQREGLCGSPLREFPQGKRWHTFGRVARADFYKEKNVTDFEKAVKEAAEKAVLKFVQDGGWLMPNYESRMKVPVEWVAECWSLVDSAKLKAKIAERLESELADRMVNHMATELATDIKQILSVQERREMLRGLAREHMDAVMKAGT